MLPTKPCEIGFILVEFLHTEHSLASCLWCFVSSACQTGSRHPLNIVRYSPSASPSFLPNCHSTYHNPRQMSFSCALALLVLSFHCLTPHWITPWSRTMGGEDWGSSSVSFLGCHNKLVAWNGSMDFFQHSGGWKFKIKIAAGQHEDSMEVYLFVLSSLLWVYWSLAVDYHLVSASLVTWPLLYVYFIHMRLS